MLAMARTGGLLLALPSMASGAMPRQVQEILVVPGALSLVATAAPPKLATLDVFTLVAALVGELIVGLVLGFVVHIVLGGIRMAGEIIGVEVGLSFSAIADPMNPGASTATAALMGHLGVQLLFALGLDRALVWGLGKSVQRVPLGGAALSGDSVAALVHHSSEA